MGLKETAAAAAKHAVTLPQGAVVGFWRGLSFPFRGAKLVFLDHPRLAKYWIPPVLLTLVASFLLGWGALAVHADLVDWIWSNPTGEGVWASIGRVVHVILEWIVLLLLWALALLLVVSLTSILASPFNDLLSEAVEKIRTGREGPPFVLAVFVRDNVRSILLELVKLLIQGSILIPLFLVSLFLPVLGQVVYSVFAFAFTAAYFAIDYVDWPATRRNRGIRWRFGLLRRHPLPMFGFGTGVWLFLFIPLVNLLFMPAVVAGGTLLFLEIEAEAEARALAAGESAASPLVEEGARPL